MRTSARGYSAVSGEYFVVVTNLCGSATSQRAWLRVVDPASTFTRITTGPIVTDPGAYWGCAWVDYDQDGDGHDSDAFGGDDCDDTTATTALRPGSAMLLASICSTKPSTICSVWCAAGTARGAP